MNNRVFIGDSRERVIFFQWTPEKVNKSVWSAAFLFHLFKPRSKTVLQDAPHRSSTVGSQVCQTRENWLLIRINSIQCVWSTVYLRKTNSFGLTSKSLLKSFISKFYIFNILGHPAHESLDYKRFLSVLKCLVNNLHDYFEYSSFSLDFELTSSLIQID